jgi:hypothetical protein
MTSNIQLPNPRQDRDSRLTMFRLELLAAAGSIKGTRKAGVLARLRRWSGVAS